MACNTMAGTNGTGIDRTSIEGCGGGSDGGWQRGRWHRRRWHRRRWHRCHRRPGGWTSPRLQRANITKHITATSHTGRAAAAGVHLDEAQQQKDDPRRHCCPHARKLRVRWSKVPYRLKPRGARDLLEKAWHRRPPDREGSGKHHQRCNRHHHNYILDVAPAAAMGVC